MRQRKRLLGIGLWMSMGLAVVTASGAPTRNIYIVAGPSSVYHAPVGHDYYPSSQIWTNRLVQRGHALNVTLLQGWPTNVAVFSNADAIVLYSEGGCNHEDGAIFHEIMRNGRWDKAMQVINRGVSFGTVHYAIEPSGAPEFWPGLGNSSGQYGTNEFVQWLGGYYAGWYSASPSPSWNNTLRANLSFPSHPLNPGISYSGATFDDEWYANIYFGQTVQPFVQLDNHPNGGGLQTVAWTRTRDDGARGFAWTGGHYTPGDWASSADTYSNMDLMLNAVEWIGKVGVDDHQEVMVRSGSTWKYDADGSMDSNWSASAFSDAGWSSGTAPLGYDDWSQDWVANTVAAGSSGNRPITTWFRKSFNVPTLNNVTNFLVKINADDGAVVYLNGTEIGRYNMPGGAVTASTTASNSPEVNWNTTFDTVCPYNQSQWDSANQGQKDAWTAEFNARNVAMTNSSTPEFYWGRMLGGPALQQGNNVLAIEVHQKDTSNPDMRLDVEASLLGNSSFIPGDTSTVTSAPAVNVSVGASDITASSATLNGAITSTGNLPTQVSVVWGKTDAGAAFAGWDRSTNLGVRTVGSLAVPVTGLTASTGYYYRVYATNAFGTTWSSASSFQTLQNPSPWQINKSQITFPLYSRAETLTNFPVRVKLGTNISGFSYGQFASTNGWDLRFSDAGQVVELPYEVEQWNTGGFSYVWVSVPVLASGTNIWVFWGSSTAGQAPATYTTNGATWNTNYVAVLHLNEVSGNNLDSTANRNNGTRNGNTNASGVAVNAQGFNGSSAYIEIPSHSSLSADAVTFELWIKPNASVGGYARPISKNFNGYGGMMSAWGMQLSADPSMLDVSIAGDSVSSVGGNLLDGNWHYVVGAGKPAGSIGAQVGTFYKDGESGGTWNRGNFGSTTISNTSVIRIGSEVPEAGGGNFYGLIDEVRVSKNVRSDNWVWATYMTLASGNVFTVYGTVISTAPPSITNAAATSVSQTSATANGTLLSTGGSTTEGWLLWGTSDGGTNKAAWASSVSLGAIGVGAVNASLSSLSAQTTYYYTFYASNTVADSWAAPASSFTTLAPATSAAPTIANAAATGVTTNTATLNGTLTSTGNLPTQVWVYWGTSDLGQTRSGWAASASLGTSTVGGLTQSATGLTTNTTYYYRYYASNSAGTAWGSPATSFTTLSPSSTNPPTVTNLAATFVSTNTATLNGTLLTTGGAPTQVWVYWGTNDLGTVRTGWGGSSALGSYSAGALTQAVTGLLANTAYYYRFYASNSVGSGWGTPAVNFATLDNAPTGSGYSCRMKLTFSGYTAPGTLTNLPVLVVLNTGIPNFSYGQFQSTNGYDLQFVDASGTNVLPYEVEKWNPAGSSYVWVSVPALAASSDYIWAQWGNSATAGQMPLSQTNGAVWDTNYLVVMHMNDPLALGAVGGRVVDSSRYFNHGTQYTNGWTNGVMAGGQSFDGDTAFIQVGDYVDHANVSLEAWIKTGDNTTEEEGILFKYQYNSSGYKMMRKYGTQGVAAGVAGNGTGGDASTANDISDDTWHFVSQSYNGAVNFMQLDGVEVNRSTSFTFDIGGNGDPLLIGTWGTDAYKHWHGGIDEVRISRIGRGSNWLWATYMTMASNSTFSSYGTVSVTTSPTVTNAAATAVATNTATLNGSLTSTGGAPTQVWVYWGTSDLGATKAGWAGSGYLGARAAGAVSTNVSGLIANTTYYYRYYASNSAGSAWGSLATSFTTLFSMTTDSDGDVIPDWWEVRFFGGTTNANPIADSDGDGIPNMDEYTCGTAPNDPASVFRVQAIRIVNGSNVIDWIGGTNGPTSPYVVESCTNLATGQWTPMGSQTRASGTNSWATPVAGGLDRFYRIKATNN